MSNTINFQSTKAKIPINTVDRRNSTISVKLHLRINDDSYWLGIEDISNGISISVTNCIEQIVYTIVNERDFGEKIKDKKLRIFQWGNEEDIYEVIFKWSYDYESRYMSFISLPSEPKWILFGKYDNNPFFWDAKRVLNII